MSTMLENPQQTFKAASTVARFAEIDRTQFKQELDKAWKALEQVRQTVTSQVEQGNLTAVQGIGTIACAAGQALGYPEFHGYPGPADLVIRAQNGSQN